MIRTKVIWAFIAIPLWCLVSWIISWSYYHYRADETIRTGKAIAELRAQNVADIAHRNMDYMRGLPSVFTNLALTKTAVTRFGSNVSHSLLTYEQRKAKWLADTQLKQLDLYLGIAVSNLKIDSIDVVNVEGDCIAAASRIAAESCVGLNYSDREYFQKTKDGELGMQYVVDRFSRLPGIYFSSPISIGGRFSGAVIVKINMPSLDFLVQQADAFLTDKNGVIILAHDKDFEFHTLPDAPVTKLAPVQMHAIYQKTDIPTLRISPWDGSGFDGLLSMQEANQPYILVSRNIPEYGLKVYVRKDMASLSDLKRIEAGLFILSSLVGSLLFLLVMGGFLHLHSVRKASKSLAKHANYDTLTELPNRRLFYDFLQLKFKESSISGEPLALMLIDLDRFKEVNDTFGHNMGDILLIEAASRIRHSLRKSDFVARLGGDEFIVILSNYDNNSTLDRIAQDVLKKLSEPFQLAKQNAYISASVGIALYPEDTTEIETLVKHADQAMYASKRSGRNRSSYFVQSLEEAAQKHMRVINDLHEAVQHDELQLYYQPIVDMKTGQIYKAEALLRWQHPRRGFVSPAEFIPVAESCGLITEIDNWVLGQVARHAEHWSKLAGTDFQISVNKSPVDFLASSWKHEESWLENLKHHSVSGKNFCIEITEGLLMQADVSINDKLRELRNAGVQVAIDDFGVGYSSLAYLKKFNIDYLKIDQSFIRDLQTDSDDRALCEAIIVMAHKLELKVIAEGVETEGQRTILTDFGCDYGQGFLFSSPVPIAELEALIRNHSTSQRSSFEAIRES